MDRKRSGFQPHLLFGLVLVLAMIVRAAVLASLLKTPYSDFLLWDERFYHEWAKKIADGTFSSSAVYEYSPLPAYLWAALYKIFSPSVASVRAFNLVAGVAVCAVTYAIARDLFDAKTALLASCLAAFCDYLALMSAVPMKETVTVLLFSVAVLFFVKSVKRPRALFGACLGAAAGLLVATRPNAIVVLPVFLLAPAIAARAARVPIKAIATWIALGVAGFGATAGPFVARNAIVAKKLTLTTSQAGFNLYIGNDPDSELPWYHAVPFATTSPFEQGAQFAIEAGRRTGRDLTPEEASSYWTRETAKQAIAHPLRFSKKMALKALAVFNRYEYADHYDASFLSRDSVVALRAAFVGFWILFPLAVLGCFFSRLPRALNFSLFAIAAVYSVTMVLFFTTSRYRLPLYAILIPFSARGVLSAIDLVRSRSFSKLRVPAVLFAVAVGLECLPLPAAGDRTAAQNTHAMALMSQGRQESAASFWRISASANGIFSDFARASLANVALESGRPDEAAKWLSEIPETSYAASEKHELLGDMLAKKGDLSGATDQYARSLDINFGRESPRLKRIVIFSKNDREMTLAEHKKLLEIRAFYRRQF